MNQSINKYGMNVIEWQTIGIQEKMKKEERRIRDMKKIKKRERFSVMVGVTMLMKRGSESQNYR